jgi:DNA-binding NarL/FixJ family response regulator
VHAVRAVVADADPLARNLLRVACRDVGVRVVAETATTEETIAVCRAEEPDVAVLGSLLLPPDSSGNGDGTHPASGVVHTPGAADIDACVGAVLALGTRVVVLSDDVSPDRLTRLLERGVSGYLLFDTPPTQVAEAVVAVATGAAVLSPAVAGTVLEQWRWLRSRNRVDAAASGTQLTPREREVLAAMAEGLGAKTIARRLGIAIKTVENHKIRIFDKLGARSQAHAVSLAISRGLLAADSAAACDPAGAGACDGTTPAAGPAGAPGSTRAGGVPGPGDPAGAGDPPAAVDGATAAAEPAGAPRTGPADPAGAGDPPGACDGATAAAEPAGVPRTSGPGPAATPAPARTARTSGPGAATPAPTRRARR